MKITKTMGAAALGLGLAVAAQAQNPIYITGSTAFRGQIFQALQTELGLTVQQGGTSGKNSFTFTGTITDAKSLGFPAAATLPANNPVTVYASFSGSAEGVQTILNNVVNNYLNVGTSSAGSFTHAGADFAFSDVAQNSTPYPTTKFATLPEIQTAADAARHNGIPGTGVGVAPFTYAVNPDGATAGINNITTRNFQNLFYNGYADLSYFVNTAPDATFVVAVGRYNLSGTRITAILDDDYSIINKDTLDQYALSPNGTSTPGLNNGDSATPTGNQWVEVSDSGYFSGGNVGAALANSAGAGPAIGYIAWADAQSKFGTTGAVPIKWNGQNPGSLGAWNITGLENGSYTFWSYERLYENPADKGTVYDSYGQALALGLQYEIVHASPQSADIEANMKVYRSNDGADITPF